MFSKALLTTTLILSACTPSSLQAMDWFLSSSGTLFIDSDIPGASEYIVIRNTKGGGVEAIDQFTGQKTRRFAAGEVSALYITGDADRDIIQNNTSLFMYADGGAGPDGLLGGSGIDILYGNTGEDYLRGGASADILNAGPDLVEAGMFGGYGADQYIVPVYFFRFGGTLFNASSFGIDQEYTWGYGLRANDSETTTQVILN